MHDAGGANVQQAWSEVPEVPPSGILRFEYVRQERQVRSTVHYSLELCDPVEREVAVQLWQRAIVEQGDNWQNQTLDGEPMDLGEEAAAAWAVPEGGRLELDYVTFDRLFEAHYRLDLKEPDERAIACKLQASLLAAPCTRLWFSLHFFFHCPRRTPPTQAARPGDLLRNPDATHPPTHPPSSPLG